MAKIRVATMFITAQVVVKVKSMLVVHHQKISQVIDLSDTTGIQRGQADSLAHVSTDKLQLGGSDKSRGEYYHASP